MSAWKRLFSADYRRALAAEASGEYDDAARAYALAGERAKVAEMHLLRAERIGAADARVAELRTGIRWADLDDPEGRAVRLRLAQALYRQCVEAKSKAATVDRALGREAAELMTELGDFAGAAECHQLIGDTHAAADAYQQAGDVEQLETILSNEAVVRSNAHALRSALEEHELAYVEGERDRAFGALERAIALSPGEDRALHSRALATLKDKLLIDGRVVLQGPLPANASEATYLGHTTVVLGRDAGIDVVLRDAGISRRHAELRHSDAGWELVDLASKNGTHIGGVRLDRLALHDGGEIGLGEVCRVQYRIGPADLLTLDMVSGLDRARRFIAVPRSVELAGGIVLSFVNGRPRLVAIEGGVLRLNGVRAVRPVQLVRGDFVTGNATVQWSVP